MSQISLPTPKPLFRHYKGGLYRTEGDCTIEASLSPGVLYRAVDPLKSTTLWLRPAREFHEEVGPGAPRFAPVRRYSPDTLSEALSSLELTGPLLASVLNAYAEPWRFFHNLEHLQELFDIARDKGLVLSQEQKLALVFHDAVYVPGAPAGRNERQSALLFRAIAPQLKSTVDVELVCRIIEETAQHTPTCEQSAVVQGLDLSSLAAGPLDFCAYNELVWLENRHFFPQQGGGFDRKAFDKERLKFLLGLAQKDSFFPPAFADLEEVARENIEGMRLAWIRDNVGS